jgi:GTP pyrophosphokinase
MIRLNDITSRLLNIIPTLIQALWKKRTSFLPKSIRVRSAFRVNLLSHPLKSPYPHSNENGLVCVATGLLHDTIEDTGTELSQIERLFGKDTANIVDGVTKIGRMQFSSSEEAQAENMRKMILAMATDIRVIIVKLADRLHNMRTLGFQPPEKQQAIARETLDIYAPLAGRMGIYWLRSDLEDLCLFYLEPEIHERIKTELAERRGAREQFIQEVIDLISTKLRQSTIEATVRGRHKHIYSIYKKMKDQNLSPSQVYDVVAFRVIVASLRECYEVLGLMHAAWKPVAGRFKDYISLPKGNMYQSLHTTVIGPLGQRMEIQIRTWDMDKVRRKGSLLTGSTRKDRRLPAKRTKSSLHGSDSFWNGREVSRTRKNSWKAFAWTSFPTRSMFSLPRER